MSSAPRPPWIAEIAVPPATVAALTASPVAALAPTAEIPATPPVTDPVALTDTAPVPLPMASIPIAAPVTDAAAMASAPPETVTALIPSVPEPITSAEALILTAPVPLPITEIPLRDPATSAAVIVMSVPLASLDARIPSPAAAATGPFTSIEIAPPPVLRATIESRSPQMR